MAKNNVLLGIESAGGGAFKHVVYLATNLPKDRFNIILIYSNNRNENIEREIEILKNHDINIIEYPMERKLSFKKDIRAIRFLMELISKFDIQIVHAHSSKAGFLFRLAGYFKGVSNIFYTPHCFHFQSARGIVKYISVCYERLMSLITSKIIVSDNEYLKAINYNVAREHRFSVINNAIPFNEKKLYAESAEIRQEFNIPNNIKYIIGGIGRLEPQKDWQTFIKVAKQIIIRFPDAIFLIVGEGSQKDFLRKKIAENNLEGKILLTGYVKNIDKIYNIIDVLVNTSLWEGLPYIALEAELYGKPIVATKAIGSMYSSKDTCAYRDVIGITTQLIDVIYSVKNKSVRLSRVYRKSSFTLFLKKHIELYSKNIFIEKQLINYNNSEHV